MSVSYIAMYGQTVRAEGRRPFWYEYATVCLDLGSATRTFVARVDFQRAPRAGAHEAQHEREGQAGDD